MKIIRYGFVIIAVVAAIISGFLLVTGYIAVQSIPSEMILNTGSEHRLETTFPLTLRAKDPGLGVITLGSETLEDVSYSSMMISTTAPGTTELSLELFGLIPIKDITITVEEERKLIPGGQSIGVMLYTNGALVVGGSDIMTDIGYINPAKEAGLLSGDVIEEVNGVSIDNSAHLTDIINDTAGVVDVTVNRNGDIFKLSITPVLDSLDNKMKIGVWVRDSTAGIGTMTFIDPKTMRFAGLGHAITDVDTGKKLSVKEGEIVFSEILEVVPGKSGEPGELKGYFDPASQVVGDLIINNDFGIYGNVENLSGVDMSDALPVMPKENVREGDATIVSTVVGGQKTEFDCRIVSTENQSSPDIKSFVIEVTDEELLSICGGIVQGMSGSPVIQDGMIVGAVTHVFVSDPTKGYGLYAEWMLEQMNW